MTIAVSTVWIGESLLARIRALRSGGAPVTPRVASALPFIDYRLAAFGGLLPDLIDKPLWWWVMPAGMTDSHAWAHTLLFSGGIILAGILLSVVRSSWGIPIIVLGIGATTHQLAHRA